MVGLEGEITKLTEQQSIKGPPSRRKNWIVVLVALTLVGFIGFVSMLLVDQQSDDERPYEFQSGEYVNYSITGEFADATPVNGSFHILPYDGYSQSRWMGVPPEFDQNLEHTSASPIDNLYISPLLAWEYKQYYYDVGNEWITTPFGDKAVRTWIGPCGNSTVVINVGLQSSLVYRMTVVNQGYHYAILMNETNSTGILDCDGRYFKSHVEAPNIVKNISYPTGTCPECDMVAWGLIEVDTNQSLRYRIEGMNGTMYMFSMNDVKDIDESGLFHYNSTLSMIHANGTVDVPVTKGIYYFFFIMDSAKEFNNDDCGWLYMYWGSRENNP